VAQDDLKEAGTESSTKDKSEIRSHEQSDRCREAARQAFWQAINGAKQVAVAAIVQKNRRLCQLQQLAQHCILNGSISDRELLEMERLRRQAEAAHRAVEEVKETILESERGCHERSIACLIHRLPASQKDRGRRMCRGQAAELESVYRDLHNLRPLAAQIFSLELRIAIARARGNEGIVQSLQWKQAIEKDRFDLRRTDYYRQVRAIDAKYMRLIEDLMADSASKCTD